MNQKRIILILTLIIIVGGIYILEGRKAGSDGIFDIVEVTAPSTGMDLEDKAVMFDKAKEITTPDAFINVDEISIEEYVGKKVVMIDFWTYSCINCQRTFPYLNTWWEKYEDEGLVIIGIHTPEFEFEKKLENVQAAVEEFGIKFPVVLDNDYSTWRAYQNRFWPRKYLIDIDGFIVYDHIGEGAYEETEAKIQELLEERKERLDIDVAISRDISEIEAEERTFVNTPEIYFGASRNTHLANGVPHLIGVQQLSFPDGQKKNGVYLDGEWNVEEEFVTNLSANAKIRLKYEASNVFMVASADTPIPVQIYRDGFALSMAQGSDVTFADNVDTVDVQRDQLYRLIEDPSGSGEHVIELVITEPGLKLFTFTFG